MEIRSDGQMGLVNGGYVESVGVFTAFGATWASVSNHQPLGVDSTGLHHTPSIKTAI